MSSPRNVRRLGLLAALLSSQLLTACVVVPVPVHRPRVVVVDGDPYHAPPPPPPRYRRY